MQDWEQRYREAAHQGRNLFSSKASSTVKNALDSVEILHRHVPSAIDIGAGEGRHALELAQRGFFVTALELSETAVHQAKARQAEAMSAYARTVHCTPSTNMNPLATIDAPRRGDLPQTNSAAHWQRSINWQCSDVATYSPENTFDLALFAYFHVPEQDWYRAVKHAATWVGNGGWMVCVGHARAQLGRDVCGPKDPDRLWDPVGLAEVFASLGWIVVRAENVERDEAETPDCAQRPVHGGDCERGIDTIVVARRP
ncbi:MAG: methyltransferase domain-containing protein [Actinomycetaceae bacterium]|nr:methyltransferase domain-containing protein [Actinomycetaceae bacterium]